MCASFLTAPHFDNQLKDLVYSCAICFEWKVKASLFTCGKCNTTWDMCRACVASGESCECEATSMQKKDMKRKQSKDPEEEEEDVKKNEKQKKKKKKKQQKTMSSPPLSTSSSTEVLVLDAKGNKWEGWCEGRNVSGFHSRTYMPWELCWYGEHDQHGVLQAWRLGRVLKLNHESEFKGEGEDGTRHKHWHVMADPQDMQGPLRQMSGAHLAPYSSASSALKTKVPIPRLYSVPDNVDP